MVSGETIQKQWPQGRPLLPQSFVNQHKREQCARALAQAAHEIGVESTTVAAVTKRARISRATFYALFDNQQDAWRYTEGLGGRLLKEAIGAAAAEAEPWEAKVEASMASLLEMACDEPHLTELCLNGQADLELVSILAELFGEGRGDNEDEALGPCTEELLARGTLAIVVDRLRRGALEELAKLGPRLTDVATARFRNISHEAQATVD